MSGVEMAFWICAVCVAYTFALYPLLMGVWARLRPRPVQRLGAVPRSVSLIVCAHNEAEQLEQRLHELTSLLANSNVTGEILLVSDGSTDATAEIGRHFAGRGVRVLELADKVGKAAALSTGCAAAKRDILVFADVRQRWAADALIRMLENFADPEVGAVTGELFLEESPGVLAGVGAYWHFEKWLRRQESCVGTMVGATGAISAVRRELFRPIPAGTVLDDVYWPMRVAMQGYRVVMEPRAHAFDRLPSHVADEFVRKVRTLSGNFQLATRLPSTLLPWRNPIWLQFVSHKLLRLAAPWLLLALLPLSLLTSGPLYQLAFSAQIALYTIGLLGLWTPLSQVKLASTSASFLVLNGASFVAFWVWISGRTARCWHPVAYQAPPAALPACALAEDPPAPQPATASSVPSC